MTITPDSLRRDLADGTAAAARADRSAAEIRKSAEARREVVADRMAKLFHTAEGSAEAGDEYQALVRERGELDLVLGHG